MGFFIAPASAFFGFTGALFDLPFGFFASVLPFFFDSRDPLAVFHEFLAAERGTEPVARTRLRVEPNVDERVVERPSVPQSEQAEQ